MVSAFQTPDEWAWVVRLAERARYRGDHWFQIQLPSAMLDAVTNQVGDVSRTNRHGGAPDLIGQIEESGWALQHASFVFVEAEAPSRRDPFGPKTPGTTTTGRVEGIYLFKVA